MQKIASIFVVLFLLVAFVQAEWIPLSRDAAEGSAPQIKIVASDSSMVMVEVTIPGFYKEKDASNLCKLFLPECATTEELGKSALPIVSGLIAVPTDTVAAHIQNYRVLASTELLGVQAYPFQKPLTDGEAAGEFLKDEKHYSSHEMYPAQNAWLDPIAVWRNQQVVGFRLVPLQSRPASGILVAHTKVAFAIRFEKGRSNFVAVPASPAFEKMHSILILNHTPQSVERASRYLVIAHDSLAEAMQPFLEWKSSKGFQTKLAKLSETGSTPEAIKAYITKEYNANGCAYVLLVGDPSLLPLYKWTNPSDYWYACVSGGDGDLYADFGLGRICATTPEQVNVYLNKFKAYENIPQPAAFKAMIATHKEGAPGKYEGCADETRNAQYSYKLEFHTRYGSHATSNNSTVKMDIDEGRGVVAYRGHGSTNSWSGWNGTSFTTTNMKSLNNSIHPVFWSIACNNAELDSSAETFAESAMSHPSGGASAFLGATRPSYTTDRKSVV